MSDERELIEKCQERKRRPKERQKEMVVNYRGKKGRGRANTSK